MIELESKAGALRDVLDRLGVADNTISLLAAERLAVISLPANRTARTRR